MRKNSSQRAVFHYLISFSILCIFLFSSVATVEAKSIKTIKIRATAGWVNTGISLNIGDKVTIQAKGVVSTLKTSPTSISGPNGQKKYKCGLELAPPPCALNYAPYGALVGKIGYAKAFMVGKKLTFTAKNAGILYLAVNDNLIHYADNKGFFLVTIDSK
jgi:hypothetical protein